MAIFKNFAAGHKRLITILIAALALFTVAGFLVLPPIIKSVAAKKLSEALHRDVSIKSVRVNPFALSVTVDGFVIKERGGGGDFVSFDRLYVNAELASVIKRGIVLREVKLINPYAHIIRNKDLSYNFSDLIEKKTTEKSKPQKFSVSNIQVLGGRVQFDDGPAGTVHKVSDVDLKVPFISNLDYYVDTFVKPHFSAVVNGTPFNFEGETKPFSDSIATSIDINLKDLDIPYYLAYSPVKMNFRIPSGKLGGSLSISYRQFKDGKEPQLTVGGDVSLRKFKVADTAGTVLVDIPGLDVSLDPSEVIKKKLHVTSVSVDSPGIDVVRDEKGNINLLSLMPESEKKPAPGEKNGEKKAEQTPLSLDVDRVKLSGGRISFLDRQGGKSFKAVLKPVDLQVYNFSMVKDWKTTIELVFDTDAGETIRVACGLQLDPIRAEGSAEAIRVPLKRYAPYYRDMVTFDILDGILGLSAGFRYSADKAVPEMRVFNTSASLNSLRIKKRDEKSDLLTIPKFRVDGLDVDMVGQKAVIGSISTEGGFVNVIRDKQGVMNLLKLVKQSGAPARKPAPAKVKAEGKEWAVTLKNADIKSWALRMEDHWPAETAVLVADMLNVKAQNIDTAPGTRGQLSMSFRPNRKGSFEASGEIGINPVLVEMKTNLKNVEVTSMQPYWSDKVKVLMTGGRISTVGKISVGYTPASGYRVRYGGDMSVNGFGTVDRFNGDDFLKWKSLNISGIDIGYNPIFVNIKSVALSGLYSRLIINQDGTINVLSVMVKEEKEPAATAPAAQEKTEKPQPAPPQAPAPATTTTAAAPPGKKPSYSAKVGTITIQDSRINFTDRHISPNYQADITAVNGKVTGLSSEETKLGNLDLSAKFGGQAPIKISGRLNPLKSDLYVDIKTTLEALDLGQFTPYCGKYVGYTIQKGQLSLNLQYLVDKRKLDAQNNIFANQFYLGDKVDSPDATKLPVKLALALLRDRHGEIHLDVPLTGSIDDPKFSLGKIIIKVILNVITKMVTSPFALLGSLFGGGGEDLGWVEFDYAGTTVSPENMKKLDNLAKALYERPALKMNIEGHADPDKDAEGLRQLLFQRQVKTQKLKDMVSEGQPAVPVDEVTLAPGDEYEKYLKKAYKAASFKRPRNFIGMLKSLPAPEMEKLMLANTQVTDDDLRQLAAARADAVRSYLTGPAKADPNRVFVVQPKELAAEKKEGVKGSRVMFVLE